MKFPSSACPSLRTPPLPLFSQGELHDEEEHMHSVALIDHKRTASYLRVRAVFKSSFAVLFYGTGCQKTHLNFRSRYFYDQYSSFVYPNALLDVFRCTGLQPASLFCETPAISPHIGVFFALLCTGMLFEISLEEELPTGRF